MITLFSLSTLLPQVRRGEALSIRDCDLRLDKHLITVRDIKNGGKEREVYIPDKLKRTLLRYRTHRDALFTVEENMVKKDWLFPGRDKRLFLSARQAQNRFCHWRKQCELSEALTIHSFRSAYATIIYEKCQDIHLVSTMMGHKSIHTTGGYIHNNASRIKEVVEDSFRYF